MIDLTCSYCGGRMEFHLLIAVWHVPALRLYRSICVNAVGDCPTMSIYKNLPQSINRDQRERFITVLNKKALAKAKEKLI